MKPTKQPTINLTLLFALTIVAGVLFYISLNQLASVRHLTSEVMQLSEGRQTLVSLAEELPLLSVETDTWLDSLPQNETDIATFATLIETEARSLQMTTSLNLDDFPGPIDVSGKYIDGLGIKITLNGSYQGLTNFLSRLSTMPYFYKIDRITITKPDSGAGIKAVIDGAVMMSLPKSV